MLDGVAAADEWWATVRVTVIVVKRKTEVTSSTVDTIRSGDASLDQAARSGITAANPLPPLPGKFSGPSLTLRFRFYYNPDKADLEEVCALARHLCQ